MKKQNALEWIKEALFYQIYPQSFYDSNDDGIGDLQGIIEKLDYVKSLGVNAIWINPCFVSTFKDAGYDVIDYYKVAPRYGTNNDLKILFKKAHERKIRVCLDLVAGHTSIEHPWFVESCKHEKNYYSDFYIWTNDVWDCGDGSIRFINGYSERNGSFAINCFFSQPALNYGFANSDPNYPWQNPVDSEGPKKVLKELKNIMCYWMDLGADGFRVDMVLSLVKNDPEKEYTIRLWQKINKWFNEKYPHGAMISEWSNPAQAIKAGFHLDFMIHFGVPGYGSLFFRKFNCGKYSSCYFDKKGKGNIKIFLNEYFKHSKNINGKGYICVPSANHDVMRMNTGRSIQDLKIIYTFLLTWPSIPLIYYGDEIGMKYFENLPSIEGGYERTGSRTPMLWNNNKNAGFSNAEESKLYAPVSPEPDRPNVEDQDKDPESLLNYVRNLIILRKSEKELQPEGKIKLLFAEEGKYPFVYLRELDDKCYMIALNPSGTDISIKLKIKKIKSYRLITGKNINLKQTKNYFILSMRKTSCAVYRLSGK